MKISIFGASGRTGKELMLQSLIKGYEVVALVRDPGKIDLKDSKLTIIQGDARNADDVAQAVKGTEVVLFALGGARKEKDLMEVSTAHIIAAMEKYGLKKIIVESSLGLFGAKDGGIIFGCIVRPLFLRNAFKDKVKQLRLLQQCSLDWVLVRPGMLLDAQKTGKYNIALDKPAGSKISRADVAEFMLAQVKSDKYLRQMPIITY
jgi:putative NADH-flavin reductase